MLHAGWLVFAALLVGVGCVPDEIKAAGGGGSAGSGGSAGASSGGASGGTSSGGAGGSATCAMSCDDQNACTDDVCEAGQCIYKYRPDGTQVPDPTPGDCQAALCDGLGKVKLVADDNDKPALDDSPCHLLSCTGGAVTATPMNEGTVVVQGTNENCLDTVCEKGDMVMKQNFKNCDDTNSNNCYLPNCHPDGACTLCPDCSNAPKGYPCLKTDMTAGTCEGTTTNCI